MPASFLTVIFFSSITSATPRRWWSGSVTSIVHIWWVLLGKSFHHFGGIVFALREHHWKYCHWRVEDTSVSHLRVWRQVKWTIKKTERHWGCFDWVEAEVINTDWTDREDHDFAFATNGTKRKQYHLPKLEKDTITIHS